MTFVVFEKSRNLWHNNQGRNFHIDLSLDKFRSNYTIDWENNLEKEIAEYLEYQEHHKVKSEEIKDYYLNLTPEKVANNLRNLALRMFNT